jgi:hypothetical protein
MQIDRQLRKIKKFFEGRAKSVLQCKASLIAAGQQKKMTKVVWVL